MFNCMQWIHINKCCMLGLQDTEQASGRDLVLKHIFSIFVLAYLAWHLLTLLIRHFAKRELKHSRMNTTEVVRVTVGCGYSVKVVSETEFKTRIRWRLFPLRPFIYVSTAAAKWFLCARIRQYQAKHLLICPQEIKRTSANLFERALHVDALVPGRGRVGQAVAGVASAADVDLLAAEGAESLGHHQHAVVR